jgi:hypothetical protein
MDPSLRKILKYGANFYKFYGTNILKEQQKHFGFMDGMYCMAVTNMFRPLI